jgi:hypothetical protein
MRSPASISIGLDMMCVPGAIPLRSAAANTIGLKDEPGCRSACVARLNWLRWKFVPPNIALTAPVRGSIATSAAAGPFGSWRIFSIACRALSWRSRSMVVVTSSPPPNTFSAPYRATSWSVT